MGIIKLGIVSADLDYSLALGEAISGLRHHFLVTLCSIEDLIGKTDGYDIILLDACSQCVGTEMSQVIKRDKRVIELVESKSEAVKNLDSKQFKLYKYGSINALTADLILFYSILTGRGQMNIQNEKCKLIAFCSIAGGLGKTSIAMGVGQNLRRYHGKSVLYLSMEEIESTLSYISPDKTSVCIGEYLYYLFKEGHQRLNAEGFMMQDAYGLNVFVPDKGKNKLRELSKEQLAVFFDALIEQRQHDIILIDMGEVFSEEILWILAQCNKICILLHPKEAESEREKRFMAYLSFALGDDQAKDFIKIRNKFTYDEDESADSRTGDCFYIDFDPESFKAEKGLLTISVDQDFGTGIKALSKKLI